VVYNEGLHDWKSSPIIIRMAKPRSIRYAGYTARRGRERMHIGY
jgi:hypothetical protein